MSIDILSALEATPTGQGGRRCTIQKFLDTIPEDSPGRDQLVATLTTSDRSDASYRSLPDLMIILSRLGKRTTVTTIGDHRSGRCLCNA